MALTVGTLIGLLCLCGNPQDEKTFQPAIKKFQEDYYKIGAKDDEKISAVNYLAQNHHERIVRVLAPLMVEASIPVRIMVARSLSQFGGVDLASRELLSALSNTANTGKKLAAVRIEILRALGVLKYKAAGPDIAKFVEDKESWVAKAAVDAARNIRCAEPIAPLIKALRRIEGKEGDAEVTVDPLDGLIEGANTGSLFKPDPAARKTTQRDLLREPILASLKALTKQNFETGKEWDAWWQKNKATFRIDN